MRTIAIAVVLLVLATAVALFLAQRSAQSFIREKKQRRHRQQAVRLPGPAPHGRPARKK